MLRPLLAALFLLAGIANLRAAVFIPLGDLPGGAFHSEATRVSADGSTVVGWSMTDRGREAFRWTRDEGMTSLGLLPGGTTSTAFGVSGDGSMIVGYGDSTSGPSEAFYWTREEGMVPIGYLPGGEQSRARAVSADGGTIVGWSQTTGGTEGFRWTRDDGMVGLGDLPGGTLGSAAQNVSDNGHVIVGYGGSESGREAFWWTPEGGMTGLGDAEGGEHESAAWDFIYERDFDTRQLVPWGAVGEVHVAEGRMGAIFLPQGQIRTTSSEDFPVEDLPTDRVDSSAYGTNRSGSYDFVVGTRSSGGSTEAVVDTIAPLYFPDYHFQPLKDLVTKAHGVDLADWRLSTAVSATGSERPVFYWTTNGIFVGTAVDANGNSQAYFIDLARLEHVPIEGANGWKAAPAGIYFEDGGSVRMAREVGEPAPLESELLSPEFEFTGDLAEISFETSWDGGDGGFNADLVLSDDPATVVDGITNFYLDSTIQTRPVYVSMDTTNVPRGTKYRLRFRYYDSNGSCLCLGPVSLDNLSLTGVTFIVPSDTDADGDVDLEDLNNVRNSFGLTGDDILGDTNDDQVIDLADLNAVRNNFGAAVVNGATVPEPAAWLLVAVSAALLAFAFGRKRVSVRNL